MTKSKSNVADIVKRTANRKKIRTRKHNVQFENLQAQQNKTKMPKTHNEIRLIIFCSMNISCLITFQSENRKTERWKNC